MPWAAAEKGAGRLVAKVAPMPSCQMSLQLGLLVRFPPLTTFINIQTTPEREERGREGRGSEGRQTLELLRLYQSQ